jgi:L-alanine-DL-glutamate epimerase-like enolase superfamily enzyme
MVLVVAIDDLPEPSNGSVRVPTRPGLGVVVDERYVKAHSS